MASSLEKELIIRQAVGAGAGNWQFR